MLLISIGIYLLLTLPVMSSIPYLDGNIDFVQSYDFASGGLTRLSNQWQSLHPPVKVLLASLFFTIGGVSAASYNLVGITFGVLGIINIYKLAHTLMHRRSARMCALLLALSPLYVATSTSSLTDFLLAIWVMATFISYAKERLWLASFWMSFAVLTKETGLLLPIGIGVSECIRLKFKLRRLLPLAIPFAVYGIWSVVLRTHGQKPWSDWIFADTAGKGTYYTVIYNLVTLSFINKYAVQNWLHLFVMNFSWVYTLISFLGLVKYRRQHVPTIVWAMVIFFVSYVVLVLSVQTYTIPRYVLPLVPLLLLATVASIEQLGQFRKILYIPIIVITFVGLITSIDPVSFTLWGETRVLGERLYAMTDHLSGNDGITYNLQYLRLLKVRTKAIEAADRGKRPVYSSDCHWMFPDPNNERKTLAILGLSGVPQNEWCVAIN